jgi:phosphopantothenoylcysteine decarboxylase/phosphopantothenate--cysteine ligase
MRICITAGPTREYIDPVRFITNASSGQMGCAVADWAAAAGHEVTLLLGPVCRKPPDGVQLVRFVTVADLQARLGEHFPQTDLLVMAAAVGDFTVVQPAARKISRRAGPIRLDLQPTPDLLEALAETRTPRQRIVAFAVEDGPPEVAADKARQEMQRKGANWVVVNTPAAIGAGASKACILGPRGVVLDWAQRDKQELARAIVEVSTGPWPEATA